MTALSFFLTVIFFLSFAPGKSQSIFKHWGKISEKDFNIVSTPLDSTAGALVIAHYGKIHVKYGNIQIDVYVRKKILNSGGFDEADITLPFHADDQLEVIKNLKARTVNRANGQTEFTDLEKRDFFTIDINDKWKAKRFTFPAISEGSIIEYRYTKCSKRYYHLDEWYFQQDIPVLHSQLEVLFPTDMEYMSFLSGPRLIGKYSGKMSNKFDLTDLPPIREQKFVYNIDNYVDKIRFQLKSYTSASERIEVIESWDKLAERILKDPEHNSFAREKKYFEMLVNKLGLLQMPTRKRIEESYKYVAENFRWNEKNRIYNYQKLNRFLEDKVGNTADINLFLINLLRAADIEAYPMLIATRSYGNIVKDYPLISQFNRLLAFAKLSDQTFVMNAIDDMRSFKLPSLEDYVTEGLVLKKDGSFWANIDVQHNSSSTYMIDLKFDDAGQALVGLTSQFKGYEALNLRKKMMNGGINQSYSILKTPNIKKLDSVVVKNLLEPSKPLEIVYSYKNPENSMITGELIYCDPYPVKDFLDNPFNEERESYPIELDYEKNFMMVITMEMPDGFAVEGIPLNEQSKLPGEIGSFTYRSAIKDQLVQLSIKVKLTRRTLPHRYNAYMKEFFDIMNEKLNEQVVLKKRSG
jgi:hypothetical protein